jgi:hypothetical protein
MQSIEVNNLVCIVLSPYSRRFQVAARSWSLDIIVVDSAQGDTGSRKHGQCVTSHLLFHQTVHLFALSTHVIQMERVSLRVCLLSR